MISEGLRQSQGYLHALERGRAGERHLYDELSRRLEGTGLVVRLATEDNHEVPFDLEVVQGDKILVGIENKDLAPSSQGTWIRKRSKDLKREYAAQQSIRLVLTTVTKRDEGVIGFREGLVNGSKKIFDYDIEHLISRILGVREG